jgi:hypothetical protein
MIAAHILLVAPADSQSVPLFAQPTVIPTGNWPAAVYSADINNDGFPDLIYIDQGAVPNQLSITHVLLNDGKGNFTQSATVQTVGNSLAFGKIGGSGTVSLAWVTVSSEGFSVQLARGKGDGTFSPTATRSPIPFPLPSQQPVQLAYLTSGRLSAAAADLYSPELIAEDIANNIVYAFVFNPDGTSVLHAGSLPDGPGPAVVTPPLGGGSGPSEPGTLVVSGHIGASAQVFGDGLAFLPLPSSTPAPPTQRLKGVSGVHSLLVQDVDNDSLPDLILEGDNGRFDIFHGNGDGTFSTAGEGGSLTLDGLTGHGGHLIAETTVANGTRRTFYTATPAGISVLTGNGNLTYTLQGIYNAGPGRTSYALADFNGDGYPDLALDSPEGIAILFGNPDGSFQTSQAYAAGQPALSAALGKLTSSGHLDAVVSTGATQAQALLGDGTGAFTAVGGASSPTPTLPQNGLPGLWSAVALADFNGDGLLDLALTADGGSSAANGGVLIPPASSANPFGVTFQFGKGDGTFGMPAPLGFNASPAPPGAPGFFYGTSAVAPALDQGLPASLASTGSSGAALFLGGAIGNGVGEISPGPVSTAHNLIAAADLRGTGLDDLLVQNAGSLQIRLNDGSARFSTLLGDLAVDGSLTTPGQLVAPALSSTFPGTSPTLGFPAFPGAAVFADLDGDGNQDLIVAYANLSANLTAPNPAAPNYVYIWFGSGGGKFLTSAKHPVNPVRITPSRNFYQVAVADLNGDKIPDLILSDGYLLSIQYGNGDGTFQAEQHLLAGQGINTLSVGDVNGDGKLDLVLANGGTVFSNPVANKEVLTPNPDVNTGGITVLLNQGSPSVPVQGSLVANPEPSAFESSFTLTATAAAPTGNPTQSSITASFTVNGNSVGSAPVDPASLQATVTVPAFDPVSGKPILPGTFPIAVTYSANYAPASSTHTVSRGPTSVVLTPTTPIPVPYGGPIDGTFAITVVDSAYPATGTYTVLDNNVAVAECTNLPINATCPYGDPQILDAGPHALTIDYNGDAINAPSASTPIGFSVTQDTTSAALASSLNPAPQGTAVTFTATLTGSAAIPTGTVQFFDGANMIGTGALSAAGVATFTSNSLTVGTHSISAFLPASPDFSSATSNPLAQRILAVTVPLPTQTLLGSSFNPAAQDQSVTFTAAVQAQGPFPYAATGTITFLDGTSAIGTGVLNSQGIATYTTSSLAVGTHSITAGFPGSQASGNPGQPNPPQPPQPPSPSANTQATPSGPGLLPSVSAPLSQVIVRSLPAQPEGFSLTVTPSPVTVGVGRTAVLLVTVNDFSGFNQPVQLSCAGLPYESTCTFTQSLIPAGGGSATLQVSTAAPHDCGDPGHPYFLGRTLDPAGPTGGTTLAALLLTGLTGGSLLRKRRSGRSLFGAILLLASLAGLATLSGCGRCTDLGTYPGAYTFTVNGVAQGGPVTQTQNRPVPFQVTLE